MPTDPNFDFLPPVPAGTEKPKPKRRPPIEPGEDHYGVQTREDKFQIRYQRPEVAEHCARLLILNNMDYEATVSKMLQSMAKANELPDPTDAAIIRQADVLRRAPQIQKALQEKLKEIGTDDKAVELLVSLLWNQALDKRNDKRWGTAVTLLSKITGLTERGAEGEKPIALQLTGADAIVKGMGIPMPSNEIPLTPPDTMEDEDE